MTTRPGAARLSVARAVVLGAAAAILVATAPSGLLLRVVPSIELLLVVSIGVVALAAARGHKLTDRDRVALRLGYFTGVAVYLVFYLNPDDGGWRDAQAYYTLGLGNPYALAYSEGGVRYTPAFFQVIEPLRLLDWPSFLFLLTAAQLAALSIIAGPIAAPLLVIPYVSLEAWFANINLLLAAAITFGFRWPALWAFVLLTKITPGIGLVWFAVRREWRHLAIALGATATIAAVSLLLSPGLWGSWIDAIRGAAPPARVADGIPLPVRMMLGAGLVAWGAYRDRAWTVPIGAAVAMPVLWPASMAILVAVIPLSRHASTDGRRRAVDWAINRERFKTDADPDLATDDVGPAVIGHPGSAPEP